MGCRTWQISRNGTADPVWPGIRPHVPCVQWTPSGELPVAGPPMIRIPNGLQRDKNKSRTGQGSRGQQRDRKGATHRVPSTLVPSLGKNSLVDHPMCGFWETQPVGRESNEDIITKPAAVAHKRTPLPDGLRWENTDNVHEIVEFLDECYVEDADAQYRLQYSADFFHFLFSDPLHRLEYSLSVRDSNRMVGYVLARVHDLTINSHRRRVVSVNFMCLRPEYRQMKLAPVIITEITRVANTTGIFQAVFTGHTDYGFAICRGRYFHLPIDIVTLLQLEYVSDRMTLGQEYKLRPTTVEAREEHATEILTLYTKSCLGSRMYEEFDLPRFKRTFSNKEKVFYTLYNHATKEFVSFFIIDTLSIEKNESFSVAYLYYWTGTVRIIEDAVAFARGLGVCMMNILDIDQNSKLVKAFPCLEGTGVLFYHLYNWRQKNISPEHLKMILY